MSTLIHPETLTITASSGTIAANTQHLLGICYNILVKPATETTTYDIKITNNKGIDIFEILSETGTMSNSVSLPVHSIYTVTLSNATVDEEFIIQLIIQE